MALVPGSMFRMGSADFYTEEQPVVEVEVGAVWMDEHPVTNAEFQRFVADTGYLTIAEQPPAPEDFPDVSPEVLVPGSQVFTPTTGPVPLDVWHRWWRWQPGADWRHPEGPASTVHGLEQHPVVHVGWEDAQAYAAWAGKRLPTEEEWEHGARGGFDQATYPWGDEFRRRGRGLTNTWQGAFPHRRLRLFNGVGTSPVGTFPPNAYGLYDVTGNVWEWTTSDWTPDHATDADRRNPSPLPACCAPQALRESDRKVIKGGSHLCAQSYCHRYRPAARQGQAVRSSTNHVGFRCVRDA